VFDGLQRILQSLIPLLIMFGARSDSLGATLSGKIANQLKTARVTDVRDAGHFLPMEKPEYVADEAMKFLSAK